MFAGCTSSTSGADVTGVASLDPAPVMTESLLLKPLDQGRITSAYGTRLHPVSQRRQMHRGIDWAAPRGTAVRAAGDGVVVVAGRLGTYGRYLRIDHGGTIGTAYAHLDRIAAGMHPGRRVSQGDLIGEVGSTGRATGPHLHYEVLLGERQIDALAFAPVNAADLADAAHAADVGVDGEFGIGGPDLDADPAAPDQPSQDLDALAADAINSATVIWVEDLLSSANR